MMGKKDREIAMTAMLWVYQRVEVDECFVSS